MRAAWSSCIGEAAERYSGGRWHWDELTVATRPQLGGPASTRATSCSTSRSCTPGPVRTLRGGHGADVDRRTIARPRAGGLGSGHCRVDGVHGAERGRVPLPDHVERPCGRPDAAGCRHGRDLRGPRARRVPDQLDEPAPGARARPRRPPGPDVRELASAYRRRGVRLALYELPTDHPVSVVMGVAFQEGGFGGPAATVGSARASAAAAARHAAPRGRPGSTGLPRARPGPRRPEGRRASSRIRAGSRRWRITRSTPIRRSGSFRLPRGEKVSWDELARDEEGAALDQLTDHFAAVGQDVVYVNLSSPDLEPLGLYAGARSFRASSRSGSGTGSPGWPGRACSSFRSGSVFATLLGSGEPQPAPTSPRMSMFRERYPTGWAFHRRTSRWPFNMHGLNA